MSMETDDGSSMMCCLAYRYFFLYSMFHFSDFNLNARQLAAPALPTQTMSYEIDNLLTLRGISIRGT